MSTSPLSQNDAVQTICALLSQLGIETNPHAVASRVGPSPSEETWAELLRAHGRPARVVRVSEERLAALPLPTLLFKSGSPHCVVRELRGRRAVVESGGGESRTMQLGELVGDASFALEIHASLSGVTSLRARLLRLLGSERVTLLQILFVTLLGAGLANVAPFLTRQVMDRALPDRSPQLLLAVSSGLFLVGAQRALLSFLRDRIGIGLNARTAYALSREGTAHALGLSYEGQTRRGLGALLQFVGSTEASGRMLTALGAKPLLDTLQAAIALAMIAEAAPLLAMLMPVAAAIALGLGRLIARSHAAHRKAQLTATSRERARLHELLAGIATIKAAGAERHATARWLGPMLDQSIARLHGDLTTTWYALWFAFCARCARVAVFAWGGSACLTGELSVGGFVALAMLTETFASAVSSLADTALVLWSTRPELAQVDEVLAEQSAPLVSLHGGERPAQTDYAVVMNDVWFRYGPDQPWVLQGYNLRVRMGEQLTLRSASGSGKTTVLRLIAGLYKPERGTISVFGRDPAQVRSHVAYLPQHAHLFAGSLLHNLRLLSGAGLEQIGRACHATGLTAFLSSLPMGLETVVPGGGGNLSGGQRQWLLLTAAVASSRRLLLMDESLSNLDRLTRARIKQGASFEGKSVIWVSHED